MCVKAVHSFILFLFQIFLKTFIMVQMNCVMAKINCLLAKYLIIFIHYLTDSLKLELSVPFVLKALFSHSNVWLRFHIYTTTSYF